MGNGFEDMLGGLDDIFGGLGGLSRTKAQRAEETLKRASEHAAKADTPMPKIRGKKSPEGIWYLRAGDVLAALEQIDSQRDSPLARKIRDLLR